MFEHACVYKKLKLHIAQKYIISIFVCITTCGPTSKQNIVFPIYYFPHILSKHHAYQIPVFTEYYYKANASSHQSVLCCASF